MAEFEVGEIYIRKEIHDEYGGQRQGGISTPRNEPKIFIFTGDSGKAHGYNDGWQTDDSFWFYGEGQQGDMDLKRGNRAIAEHSQNGKSLHLFHIIGRGKVRYEGEFCCKKYFGKKALDADGNIRNALVFQLRRV